MLKYILLIVFNAPLVVYGGLRSIRNYRIGIISHLRFVVVMVFWLLVLSGLIFAEPLYSFLVRHNLTDSTPLTVFDVVEITGIILALTLCLRLYAKYDATEQRLNQLNRELTLREAKKPRQ